MQTDRELLELAAKAARYRICHFVSDTKAFVSDDATGERFYWAPKDDDGDSLRLAVRLDIELQQFKTIFIVKWAKAGNPYEWLSEILNPDPYAAARRAIFRAAAAIGEKLK